MATGAPDWFGTRWKVEATLRPNLIHPTGNVLFMERFDFPSLSWEKSGSGTHTELLRTNVFFSGNNSLRIDTSAVNGTKGGIVKSFALVAKKKIGIELRYNNATPTSGLIRLEIEIFDGTNLHDARINYSFTDQKWQYYDSSDAFVDVPGGAQNLAAGSNIWHLVKLVYDYDKDKYVRLYSDGTFFDLSALSGHTVADASNEELRLKVFAASTEAVAVVSYIDNIVLTEE